MVAGNPSILVDFDNKPGSDVAPGRINEYKSGKRTLGIRMGLSKLNHR